MDFRLFVTVWIGLVSYCAVTCTSNGTTVSFNDDIRPIFNQKCLKCHGGVKKQGDLSLLFREDALQPAKSGKIAIIPGSPLKSELIKRISHHDPEERMPLDAEPLTNQEKKLIKRWITQGAQWEEHWSFKPVEKPNSTGIDHFIHKKLKEVDLHPAPEANKEVLAHRVGFDLTGLPVDEALLQAFLTDNSSTAYETLVDSLLASPAFGERWASWWMDLARYADSKGYESDMLRPMWPYRDWLIKAFNADQGFDQFTIEQIAGDLLPQPTRDQLIATAFHRNTMTNAEGGTDDEEFRMAAVIDRLNTTFEVWQGVTIGCGQCHGHPYDPFRHEDYYKLLAFLNNSADADLTSEFPVVEHFEERYQKIHDSLLQIAASYWPQSTGLLDSDPLQAIKVLSYPVVPVYLVDELDNTTLEESILTNFSYNANSLKDKHFTFVIRDVDLTHVSDIEYEYAAGGDDAVLELRLQSFNGQPVSATKMWNTQSAITTYGALNYKWIGSSITPVSGLHDLFFSIVNTTQRIPEGIILLKNIRLKGATLQPKIPAALAKKLQENWERSLKIPVMAERKNVRPTHVLLRGNWLTKGELVSPEIPSCLPSLTDDNKPDRLDFARWLVSTENPLTGRVLANRVWEQIFGAGLVVTAEDFGSQGVPPTHPELLDYLAWRFSHDYSWSFKQLLREIVCSKTYKQSSEVEAEKLTKDPVNQYLSRGPRIRLSAEQIRDRALSVSGLLSKKMYGPSAMPPQPEGIWQVVYSGSEWKTSLGEDRYRRAIYTFWRRTSPYPTMITFDSPSREFCVSRRIRTNTPLQALTMLNDSVYMEAAQGLARQMKANAGASRLDMLNYGYHKAIGRSPSPLILAELDSLFVWAAQNYECEKAAASIVAGQEKENPEELAALTIVANAIMNLDAFVMKE